MIQSIQISLQGIVAFESHQQSQCGLTELANSALNSCIQILDKIHRTEVALELNTEECCS